MISIELGRAFGEVQLPYTELKINPRRFARDTTGFYVDVRGTKNETFRVYQGNNVAVHVIDKRPDIRHMLVNINTERNKTKMLFGHDERHLFVLNSPSCKSIDEAFQILKPNVVREAERRGSKILRQGEWFFVPVRDEAVAGYLKFVVKKTQIPSNGRGFNPHVADEMINMLPEIRKNPLWRFNNHTPIAFVRGKIRHGQHSTIELKTWHSVYHNLELSATSSPLMTMGYLD